MKQVLLSAVLMTAWAVASAKLPPLDDAAKAKAAEAAARTAWQGKGDAYLTCKAQDRVAAHYRKTAGSTAAKDSRPAPTAQTVSATSPATAVAPPAAPQVAGSPAVPGGTAAAVAGAPTPTPCADPGPFAYSPPAEKPLEASGAHSPAGNATSPPSVKVPSAEMAPAKK